MRRFALGLLTTAMFSGPLMAAPISTVFTISLENHNFTQLTTPAGEPQQLLGNAAAPYLNSLVTAGNPNAKFTSFFSKMTNVAPGIHPSEPNYIWQNGGSNFGVATGSVSRGWKRHQRPKLHRPADEEGRLVAQLRGRRPILDLAADQRIRHGRHGAERRGRDNKSV